MYTNKINNKKYIGITKNTLSRRAGKDGIEYRECPKYWNAIQKYGWENFVCEVLEENLTPDEAKEKEIFYI